jgi:hypothetical protein
MTLKEVRTSRASLAELLGREIIEWMPGLALVSRIVELNELKALVSLRREGNPKQALFGVANIAVYSLGQKRGQRGEKRENEKETGTDREAATWRGGGVVRW